VTMLVIFDKEEYENRCVDHCDFNIDLSMYADIIAVIDVPTRWVSIVKNRHGNKQDFHLTDLPGFILSDAAFSSQRDAVSRLISRLRHE